MPRVKSFAVMDAVYRATLECGRHAPTTPFEHMSPLFRAFPSAHFVVDTYRHIFRRDHADGALMIWPNRQDENRWTGSVAPSAQATRGGLYCSIQGQATVNEAAHYFQREREVRAAAAGQPAPSSLSRTVVLTGKCVVRLRLLGHWLAADLSARHNPGVSGFLARIGDHPTVRSVLRSAGYRTSVNDLINHPDDCSVARGIGLAIDAMGYRAMLVETARESERSASERGDNLVLFGDVGQKIRNVSIDEAYVFPVVGRPERYPVEF